MSIKLAVVCQIRLFAEGLRSLLENDGEIEVVGLAASICELKELLPLKPNIILTDSIVGEEIFCCEALEYGFKILIVSNRSHFLATYPDLQAMAARGFAGILPCEADPRCLKKAIRAVHAGEIWIDNKTLKRSLNLKPPEQRNISLTEREKKVLQHICEGLSNREIAERLFVTEQTIKVHVNHLFKKYEVPNRVRLVLATHDLVS